MGFAKRGKWRYETFRMSQQPAHPLLFAVAALFTAILARPAEGQSLGLLQQVDLEEGANSVAYSRSGFTVAATVTNPNPDPGPEQDPELDPEPMIGVQLYTLGAGGGLSPRSFISLAEVYGGAIASVSSVALDPRGRGIGVATVIPLANRTSPGAVAFFDHRPGTDGELKVLTVGFHPKQVIFSRDGSKVFVADEGEYTGNSIGQGGGGGNADAPGSVSVIDLSEVLGIADLEGLEQEAVTTYDFTAPNLAAGVTLAGLRFNEPAFSPGNEFRHVEPEAIAEGDGVLYITLQENNAIAEFALEGDDEGTFTKIHPLGTLSVTIDASDRDGEEGEPAALISQVVKGAPMPEAIATYEVGGVLYAITANAGAFRPDNDDRVRVGQFSGQEIGIDFDRSDAALGRLRVVRDLSDPDDDDLLDDVVMPGTRSFSIWNAATGELVGDTGNFEPLLLDLFPDLHNIDGEEGLDSFDFMSPEKGPEPRALTYARIGATHYVFVGMAKQGAILVYNVNNPANPVFVSAVNDFGRELVAPRSLVFVPGATSPSGRPFLLVGYGGGGKIGVYRLADGAPGITTRARVRVAARARAVTLRGRATPNTARVTLNRRAARGTVSWSGRLPFPPARRQLRVRVEATSTFGVVASRQVRVVRQIRRRGR